MRLFSGLYHKFMNSGIFFKLLIGYLLVVLLPTASLSSVVYRLNYDNLQQRFISNEQLALDTAQRNFLNQLDQAKSLSAIFSSNASLKKYLAGFYGNTSESIYVYMQSIQPFYRYLAAPNSFFTNVVVYSYSGKDVQTFSNLLHLDALAREHPARTASLEMEPDGIFRLQEANGELELLYFWPVYNESYNQILGIAQATLNMPLLLESFSPLSNLLLFTDADGAVMLSYDGTGMVTPLAVPPDGNAVMQSVELAPLDVTVVQYVNYRAHAPNESRWMIGLFLLLGLLLPLLYYLIVTLTTRRIVLLNQHISSTDVNNLSRLETKTYQDEAGNLITSFNQIVDRINELIHEVYETRLRQKDAEYYAMQAQIKPHFLFNVLENIRMEALKSDGGAAADMIQLLGQYMRYNLSKSKNMVTLLDELTNARQFLAIHKIRLGERLQSRIECHTEIDDVICPRFLLQPILENALQHGLGDVGPTRISIAVLDGGEMGRPADIAVVIADDGRGISDQGLAGIREMLADTTPAANDRHVGIKNVSHRLQALWGAAYRLQIASRAGEGTAVTIFLKGNSAAVQEPDREVNVR